MWREAKPCLCGMRLKLFSFFAMDLKLEVVLKIDLVVQDLRVLKERRCFFERRSKQKCGHTDPCLSFQTFSEYEAEPLLVIFYRKEQFWIWRSIQSSNHVA